MPLEKLKSELGVHKRNQWGYRRENFLMHTMALPHHTSARKLPFFQLLGV